VAARGGHLYSGTANICLVLASDLFVIRWLLKRLSFHPARRIGSAWDPKATAMMVYPSRRGYGIFYELPQRQRRRQLIAGGLRPRLPFRRRNEAPSVNQISVAGADWYNLFPAYVVSSPNTGCLALRRRSRCNPDIQKVLPSHIVLCKPRISGKQGTH